MDAIILPLLKKIRPRILTLTISAPSLDLSFFGYYHLREKQGGLVQGGARHSARMVQEEARRRLYSVDRKLQIPIPFHVGTDANLFYYYIYHLLECFWYRKLVQSVVKVEFTTYSLIIIVVSVENIISYNRWKKNIKFLWF
ncbi:hypothetical protein HAX54_049364 [Datura stramonium]|uniref:Uncharacterized protein n=1 Tax=Datura stramonium TaxID=4076 RepID=A0ABS8WMZ6_DATST|nr:hypothetical protein [Datura stramonium]